MSRNDFLHLDAFFPGAMTSTRQAYLEIACLPWHFTFCWMSRRSLPRARFRSALVRNQVAPQLSATFNCEVEFDGQGIEIVYFAGQTLEIGEVKDKIWLVSFMNYNLGFFDEDVERVEPAMNSFVPEL